MCGIAGALHFDGQPASPVVVRAMARALAHRGPDGEGVFVDGELGLGHRRLAILDLTPAGAQPMQSREGDAVLSYNGEVYNFQELRGELEALGHRFRSTSDAEVVLEAYRAWGPACVERFNGMFAFALWDARARRLFLARDRYGIKPLYYTRRGQTFLFASEVKALREHPAFETSLSLPHLVEYLTFQNLLSEGTLFAGVKLLPPGTTLEVEPSGELRQRRYWDFDFREPDQPLSPEVYEEELSRLFRQAVQRQLVSDASVGAYLSGGLDSGGISAVAAESLPHLTTFTCGFDMTSASGLELSFDERAKAEALSYRFKTEHYEVVLKAGDMERCLPKLVWHLEDLRVGQSYPNYYVARLASKFAKSVLGGTGGDELFAGYPWRYYRAVVNDDFDHYVAKYYDFWSRLLPSETLPAIFRPELRPEADEVRPLELFRGLLGRGSTEPPRTPIEYVNRSLAFEARAFLHGLLVVEDRLSMAHGLESRVPFLDNDLVDFAQRVPMQHKLRDLSAVVRLDENEPGPKTQRYFERTRDGKLLLRQVLRRYVPEEVVDQVKQGFSGPDASWFRGESIEWVRSVVSDDHARIYDYLDPALVRGLVGEHLSGQVNRRLLIWSLLNLEQWLEAFL